MQLEYKTFSFANDAAGLARREECIQAMAAAGWRIESETIDPGHIKGGQACCLATICLPLGFAAGRTPSTVSIIFAKESVQRADAEIAVAHPSGQSAVASSGTLSAKSIYIGGFLALALAATLVFLQTQQGQLTTSDTADSNSTNRTHLAVAKSFIAKTDASSNDLQMAWMHLNKIPPDSQEYSEAKSLREALAPRLPARIRKNLDAQEAVSASRSKATANSARIDLKMIALRRRPTVERIVGKPRSAERVKYSSPIITAAKYGWGSLYYQEGRLTGLELHFDAKGPRSIEEVLAVVGLEMTSPPESHPLYYSWSSGPSAFRPDADRHPLVCCGFTYELPWVSIARDFTNFYADFAYLNERQTWSDDMRQAWRQLDN
jgi:hypothetical protein